MIFQAFSAKTIHINLFFDQKTIGGQWPGQCYSKVRPMSHKRTTYKPPPTPPKGEGDKKGITIAIRYTYNW